MRRKLRALEDNLRQTDALYQSSKDLRAPLVAKVKELTQKGDDVAGQPDSQDPKVLAQQRKDLDALTAQFKQVSASLLPLGKQSILLDIYKRTTTNWRNAVESQYKAELKGLLLRLGCRWRWFWAWCWAFQKCGSAQRSVTYLTRAVVTSFC